MAGVRMVLTGSEAALAKLGAAIGRTDRPRDLFDEIGAAMVVSTQNRFETETDPDGDPWAKSLRALLDGGRTLTDTAHLVSSLTHEASDTQVAWGTNVPYAVTHQTGMTIKAKSPGGMRWRAPGNGGWVREMEEVTIPQRSFLGVDEDDEAEIEAIASDWLMTPLGETGGADARP